MDTVQARRGAGATPADRTERHLSHGIVDTVLSCWKRRRSPPWHSNPQRLRRHAWIGSAIMETAAPDPAS